MHTRNRPPALSSVIHMPARPGHKHTTSRGLVVALVVQLSCGLAPWLWEPNVRERDARLAAGLSAWGRA